MKDNEWLDYVHKIYHRIASDERQWARLAMSTETVAYLTMISGVSPANSVSDTLFGIPIDIDNSLPFKMVVPNVETPQEQRLKAFAKEMSKNGKTVVINVARPAEWSMPLPPPPKPTLRALLKHWFKRGKK